MVPGHSQLIAPATPKAMAKTILIAIAAPPHYHLPLGSRALIRFNSGSRVRASGRHQAGPNRRQRRGDGGAAAVASDVPMGMAMARPQKRARGVVSTARLDRAGRRRGGR